MPTLPPELIDIIVDFLHGDRHALGTCARVCKAWVSASRRNLFAKVSSHTLRYESPWRDLAGILSSQWCTIGPAVRQLDLDQINRSEFSWLEEVTSRLSNLRELSLGRSYLSTAVIFSSLDPVLRNIETLHLARLNIEPPDILLSLLQHRPRLQSLFCNHIRMSAMPHLPRDALMPGLRSLVVHQSTPMLNLWIASCWMSTAPQVTALDLNLYENDLLHVSMMRMAETIGSTLQVIRLSVLEDALAQIAPCLSLLTRLRSVHLDFENWDEDAIGAARFTAQALPHFTSQHLEEVTATLVALQESNVYGIEIQSTELDCNLPFETPPLLPTLRNLTFRFVSHRCVPRPEVAKAREVWVAERFPLYATRGILNVQSLSLGYNTR